MTERSVKSDTRFLSFNSILPLFYKPHFQVSIYLQHRLAFFSVILSFLHTLLLLLNLPLPSLMIPLYLYFSSSTFFYHSPLSFPTLLIIPRFPFFLLLPSLYYSLCFPLFIVLYHSLILLLSHYVIFFPFFCFLPPFFIILFFFRNPLTHISILLLLLLLSFLHLFFIIYHVLNRFPFLCTLLYFFHTFTTSPSLFFSYPQFIIIFFLSFSFLRFAFISFLFSFPTRLPIHFLLSLLPPLLSVYYFFIFYSLTLPISLYPSFLLPHFLTTLSFLLLLSVITLFAILRFFVQPTHTPPLYHSFLLLLILLLLLS
ncbi:unnamed protein product [Acanthosepion pharaonis]|uniref:Uncharacterized protein n=1 Tax=Acanthosepion pharaonis TaxID=158019 RepID=A0A812EBW4_ACAPH|nr:unnamed protein product [Sepia pharaonis]